MPQPETRLSLIARLNDPRNEPAWRHFMDIYEPFLRRLAVRQGVPERHVPDVVQQVLLAIAKSVDGWQDDGSPASFRRWLATVSRNIVIKFMTRERKQAGGHGGTEIVNLLSNIPAEPDADQVQRYEHELIVWAAEQVRSEFVETSWKAFWATIIEGRTVSDVAAELGVSPGSIYMSRSRIMAKIRTKVEEVMT
ncbi:MAG: sigma-70 family RNA polymerase sigma factor [Planctomycetaceae bacterium]